MSAALPPALRALLVRRAHEAFAWGTRDCAGWVFDAVAATTGRDSATAIRGRWHDARSAARVLRSLGGWAGVASQCWGPEVPTAQARVGDVVQLAPGVCRGGLARQGAVGVCLGKLVAAQGQFGLVLVPLTTGQRAWRAA